MLASKDSKFKDICENGEITAFVESEEGAERTIAITGDLSSEIFDNLEEAWEYLDNFKK